MALVVGLDELLFVVVALTGGGNVAQVLVLTVGATFLDVDTSSRRQLRKNGGKKEIYDPSDTLTNHFRCKLDDLFVFS